MHTEEEYQAVARRLAEMEKALRAHLQVNPRGGLPPKRLDEALSWVENDRIVTEMVNKALTTTMNVCTKCDQWIIKGQICTDATLTQHENCDNPWPKSESSTANKELSVLKEEYKDVCAACERQGEIIAKQNDALKFYANDENWLVNDPNRSNVHYDHGDMAKNALEALTSTLSTLEQKEKE